MCQFLAFSAVLLIAFGSCVEARFLTGLPQRCVEVSGRVRCANGNKPAPTAYLVLNETDVISEYTEYSIKNGYFTSTRCTGTSHPYSLEFRNVCGENEIKTSGPLNLNRFATYIISDNSPVAFAQYHIGLKSGSDCLINAGLSQGCDFAAMIEAKRQVSPWTYILFSMWSRLRLRSHGVDTNIGARVGVRVDKVESTTGIDSELVNTQIFKQKIAIFPGTPF